MPDIQQPIKNYGTKLTDAGSAMIAACILNGTKLNITEAAAGDGGGAYYEPERSQTALVREQWRGGIAAVKPNAATPNMLDVKVIIPSSVSGFTVREMGLFGDDGTLIAVCNTPDTEKTSDASGAAGKLTMIMHILVLDASVVDVTVNPSLDTVSWEQLEDALGKKQDKLTGEPGQIPVFNAGGGLEAQDYSSTAVYTFAEADWGRPAAAESDDSETTAYSGAYGYEITLPAEIHGRKSGAFTFQAFSLVNGAYMANTWAALGTGVQFNEDTNTVILSSGNPYSGKILFVG